MKLGLHNVTVSVQLVELRLVFVTLLIITCCQRTTFPNNPPRPSRLVGTVSLPATNQSAVFICGPERDLILLFSLLWEKETRLMLVCFGVTRSADRDRDAACFVFSRRHDRETDWACCHGYRVVEGG